MLVAPSLILTGGSEGSQSRPGSSREENSKRGNDKSLVRPGRKQATATKLGIYSTYSHEVLHNSYTVALTSARHSKKIQKIFRPARFPRQQRPPRRTKMETFRLLFQSREQMVVRRGQIRRIGWVIKTLEAQVVQFLLDCKCPVSRDIVVQEQDTLVTFPRRFSFKSPSIHQQGWVILRVDSLALWKIINVEDAFLIPSKKSRGEKIFSGFLHSEFFGGGVNTWTDPSFQRHCRFRPTTSGSRLG